jgi:DNA-directed RNA polymerase specialized sigma24 family protein
MAMTLMMSAKVAACAWNGSSMEAHTDEQLLKQFTTAPRETAEAAFAVLVERYKSIVYRVCHDTLDCPHETDDAAQAVFLIRARKAATIRKPASLGPWLHGVACRVATRAKRDAARRRSTERKKAETTRELKAAGSEQAFMGHGELHEEINRLPEQYRLPIILCYLQGGCVPDSFALV